MLQHLSVENYALIKQLDLSFNKGFTTITGETGAGKSILLGALSLILGSRADSNVLNDPEKKCFIEGTFLIGNYKLQDFFTENELDYDEELILRREINKQGKSRAFINDTPVRLQTMKDLGVKLVDIHSQNNTLTLNNSDVQLAVVDTMVKHQETLNDYAIGFKTYQKLLKHYNLLLQKDQQSKADLDYYQFLYDELEKTALKAHEQEETEQELELQNHAEGIKTALSSGTQIIYQKDESIIEQLKSIYNLIDTSAGQIESIMEVGERLRSTIIELEDLSGEMDRISADITYDPQRIEELNARLDTIYSLQQKHRVNSLEELLEKQNDLEVKLHSISSLEQELLETQQEIDTLRKSLEEQAAIISENRRSVLPDIEKEISLVLKELGMPDAVFEVKHTYLDELSREGKDRFEFLFNANKGLTPQPIAKVASGGELSRLMLSVKSLIAHKTLLPTIIFDEIDSGVSGDIAGKTGNIMKKMAKEVQVIAITHLPQIAGKGHTHLFVRKQVDNGKTFSQIKELNNAERVEELAKMLSDDKITEAALETARELMNK